MPDSKPTALHDEHVRLKGRMVDFSGWNLPIQYTGVIEEHQACREAAGLFDVSHMAEFLVEGNQSEAFLNHCLTNNLVKLNVNQAQYNLMCHETGGIVDDLVVYRTEFNEFLLVVNAANADKDWAHLQKQLDQFEMKKEVKLTDVRSNYTQIAIQGPKSQEILQKLTTEDLSQIKTYWFTQGKLHENVKAIIARTGYTGEDGFELYVPWDEGPKIWQALMEHGKPLGLRPCGLGARDTLRLEMKFPLYGQELNDESNPIEAGLGWVVKLQKGPFVGSEAIAKAKEAGVKRKLIGLKMIERGIPRQGYRIFGVGTDVDIGYITSGTLSPSLGHSIAIAYMSKDFAEIGTQVAVEIRGKRLRATVEETPFYKRPY